MKKKILATFLTVCCLAMTTAFSGCMLISDISNGALDGLLPSSSSSEVVEGNPLLEAYVTNCRNKDISCLFDGNKTIGACWFSPDGDEWGKNDNYPIDIVLHYAEPKTIEAYALTTGVDNVEYNRSPKAWKFYGSNDGEKWDKLDEISDAGFTGNWQTLTFVLNESVTYSYYKWTILENAGGWGTQLGELELLTPESND